MLSKIFTGGEDEDIHYGHQNSNYIAGILHIFYAYIKTIDRFL